MVRVSIGLPVFNGEKYLRKAIDSILAQTFDDFELIISDNASTDSTEEICREYAAEDPRVRYIRNENNLGAAKNFNRVFELSGGEYFKWATHDDVCAPDFLLKCVEVLDQRTSVVLCYSKVRVIDEQGRFIKNYDFKLNGNSQEPSGRFRYQIRAHMCYEIFGLIRTGVLKMTPLMGNYGGGDAVLLIRLCLLGQSYEIPERLFFSRTHPQQSGTMRKNFQKYTVWFDSEKEGQIVFPYWRILFEYIKSVSHSSLEWHERLCCYLYIGNWFRMRLKPLVRDMIKAVTHISEVVRMP